MEKLVQISNKIRSFELKLRQSGSHTPEEFNSILKKYSEMLKEYGKYDKLIDFIDETIEI